ncbi:MAG: hypothetical protein AB7P40_32160, partial [Chloroflexota bacterium]
ATRTADGSYLLGVTTPTRLLFRGIAAGPPMRWTLSVEGVVVATFQPSGSGPVTLDLEAGRTYELVPTL